MKKSDDSLRQAQEDVERRKRLVVFGKIRVDPEPTTKSPLKQKDEEKKGGHREPRSVQRRWYGQAVATDQSHSSDHSDLRA